MHPLGPFTYYLDEDANGYGFRDKTGRHFATLDAPPRGHIKTTAQVLGASADLLHAAELALPWLAKFIADDGHLASTGPGYAVRALEQLSAAIDKATTAEPERC